MKNYIITLIISIVLVSCNSKKEKTETDSSIVDSVKTTAVKKDAKTKVPTVTDVYFTANGSEPFWSLTISDTLIKLKTINDSILTPHTTPIRAMDSNVKIYKLHTETNLVNFQIHQSECISVASGEASGYKVHVEYKRTSENDFKQLEGCGNYILDYRLNDIWVLEKLNGTEVSLEDFAKEIPTLEINSSNKTFFGYAGCNRMNGSLFSENDLLRFTKIVITKMMCQPHNKESEFLKALQSTITYNIEHNQLKLSNPDRELLIFKKID